MAETLVVAAMLEQRDVQPGQRYWRLGPPLDFFDSTGSDPLPLTLKAG
jgi:hypothetical protein